MKKIPSVLLIFIFAIKFSAVAQQGHLHIINTFHIGGFGKWDYIQVGPVDNLLYVSHGTQVNIINKNTGDSVGVIQNTIGVHGIAFDVENNKGFTSNGRSNSITVFNMNTNKIINEIPAGKNPDAIFYDSFSKKIITCNGHSESISIIDPVNDKVIDSINVGGSPETAVSDGAGKLFINVEDKNEIVVVDAKNFTVLNHWSIAPGVSPTGLSIDINTKRLFAGCKNMLVIINAVDGSLINNLPIGKGCDGTAFDPATNIIYASCGDGTLTAIHEDDANKFTVIENALTKKGARTLSLDTATHLIYLPTAEFEPLEPGQTGRPKTKDGTFQVLVVGK
jgi:YVTN family beta-propeller protein